MATVDATYTYTIIKRIKYVQEQTHFTSSQRCSTHEDIANANSALHKLYHSIHRDDWFNGWQRARNEDTGLFEYTYHHNHGHGSFARIALSIERTERKMDGEEAAKDEAENEQCGEGSETETETEQCDDDSESESERKGECESDDETQHQAARAHDAQFRQGMKEAMKQEIHADLWDEIRKETLADGELMRAVLDEVKQELKRGLKGGQIARLKEEVRKAIREEETESLREEVREVVREEEGERHRAEMIRLFEGLRRSTLSGTSSSVSGRSTPGFEAGWSGEEEDGRLRIMCGCLSVMMGTVGDSIIPAL